MEIVAVADVHSPKYLKDYEKALRNSKLSNVGLMFFVGDMIYKGKWFEFKNVINITRRFFKGKIIACFGNEEYDNIIPLLIKNFSDIIWLNDEAVTLDYNGKKLFIVGTKGVLDRPTTWQRTHIPQIYSIYSNRLERIGKLIREGKRRGYLVILLTHYPPTYKTLIGEPKYAWAEMGSEKAEEIIKENKPDIVIHGHAHNSKKTFIQLNSTRIYNVALPAVHKITKIPLEYGLLRFFS